VSQYAELKEAYAVLKSKLQVRLSSQTTVWHIYLHRHIYLWCVVDEMCVSMLRPTN
jgi:hypothetical protein